MKTQYCDECEHRKWVGDGNGLACKIGHKPRFFKPTGNPYFENWGWKRKCADFVVGKHVQMLTTSNAELRGAKPIGEESRSNDVLDGGN